MQGPSVACSSSSSDRPWHAASASLLHPWKGSTGALICAIWHMLTTGETYRDLGADYFTSRDPQRQTRRLVKQLERLGHHVTLTEGAAAA
jgi:hypothetical protein